MSCDFAVWYPNKKMSNKEALAVYVGLCDGNEELVTPHDSINDFYNELTAMHPEIDDIPDEDIDNTDLCPWSIAFDRSPGHIIMCCVWSKAEYVEDLIKKLAKKHSLAVFDPQKTELILPCETSRYEKNTSKKPWWKIW